MLSSRLVRGLCLLTPRLSQVNGIERRGITTWWANTLREMKERDKDFDLIPQPKRHRREWIDWNYDCELFAFGKRLNEELPIDKLKRVFTDQSYVDREMTKKKELGLENVGVDLQSNIELAVKGDKIIQQFVSSYLRLFLPRVPEECILSILSHLSSDKCLSHIGGYIGCTQMIMSPLVEPTDEMIANSLKSLLAIIEEQGGPHQCHKFIIDIIMPYLQDKDLLAIWNPTDPETKVRNILMNEGLPDFEPRLMRETGRNSIYACYMVGLYVNKSLIGYGPGETIEIAREMAAYEALRRFFNLTISKVLFKFGPVAYSLDYKSKQNQPNPFLKDWRLTNLTERTISNQKRQALSM